MREFKWVSLSSGILAAFGLILIFIFTGAGFVSAQASAPKPATQETANEKSLLQFTAGGHVMGFRKDRVYFASTDHAIIEEFVGTKGVMPVGEAGKAAPNEKKGGEKGLTKAAPALGTVAYKNLWKGVTLRYEAKNGGIAESFYRLDSGADAAKIRLRYNVPVGIEKDGSLRFRHTSENGYFSQSSPKAWQDIEGKRIAVEVAFADYGDNTIGFRLGEYNRQYPLVIDPTYSWHTFYGSADGSDGGNSIAVDSGGNLYITGYSVATWNGPLGQAPLNAYSGYYDIFILKLNSAGVYQWHTFYGSDGDDYGNSIAVDSGGNLYITGTSYGTWNWPGTAAPLNAYSGYADIFILKLNSAGAYQWHTFYGSAGFGSAQGDYGNSIAVDSGGNLYITGNSYATWNGPGAAAPLNAYSGSNDVFVLKLSSAGAYQWHTFYGSAAGSDSGNSIAVDSGGNLYITGLSIPLPIVKTQKWVVFGGLA